MRYALCLGLPTANMLIVPCSSLKECESCDRMQSRQSSDVAQRSLVSRAWTSRCKRCEMRMLPLKRSLKATNSSPQHRRWTRFNHSLHRDSQGHQARSENASQVWRVGTFTILASFVYVPLTFGHTYLSDILDVGDARILIRSQRNQVTGRS